MKLQAETWSQPQICGDCHIHAAEGYQELKYSPGGPHLEKRCRPCAISHYGKGAVDQADAEKKKSRKKAEKDMEYAPLLGRTG